MVTPASSAAQRRGPALEHPRRALLDRSDADWGGFRQPSLPCLSSPYGKRATLPAFNRETPKPEESIPMPRNTSSNSNRAATSGANVSVAGPQHQSRGYTNRGGWMTRLRTSGGAAAAAAAAVGPACFWVEAGQITTSSARSSTRSASGRTGLAARFEWPTRNRWSISTGAARAALGGTSWLRSRPSRKATPPHRGAHAGTSTSSSAAVRRSCHRAAERDGGSLDPTPRPRPQ